MLRAVLQPGMGDDLAKLEGMWKTWKHHVDVYENLAASRLDGDVKISVVLREAPPKLRDNLLVDSQQLESNYNKLRPTIQAYLNPNKSCIANGFRSDTKESDPMEVDNIDKRQKANAKAKGKDSGKSKSKEAKRDKQDKECHVCGTKGHFARDCWSRTHQDKTVNEVESAKGDGAAKECVFKIGIIVKDVSLSKSGCESHEDGLCDDRLRSIRQRLPQVARRIRC